MHMLLKEYDSFQSATEHVLVHIFQSLEIAAPVLHSDTSVHVDYSDANRNQHERHVSIRFKNFPMAPRFDDNRTWIFLHNRMYWFNKQLSNVQKQYGPRRRTMLSTILGCDIFCLGAWAYFVRGPTSTVHYNIVIWISKNNYHDRELSRDGFQLNGTRQFLEIVPRSLSMKRPGSNLRSFWTSRVQRCILRVVSEDFINAFMPGQLVMGVGSLDLWIPESSSRARKICPAPPSQVYYDDDCIVSSYQRLRLA